MNRWTRRFLHYCFFLVPFAFPFLAQGVIKGINPDLKFVADTQKTNVYRTEAVVDGGDRSIQDVIVLEVRHNGNHHNRGYERVVFDVEGNHFGEKSPIPRPPYYHVSVESKSKQQIVFTLMGSPKLAVDGKKLARQFKKSKLIRSVQAYPVLSNDRWTFVMQLAKPVPVEVFELVNPLRIIIDLKAK